MLEGCSKGTRRVRERYSRGTRPAPPSRRIRAHRGYCAYGVVWCDVLCCAARASVWVGLHVASRLALRTCRGLQLIVFSAQCSPSEGQSAAKAALGEMNRPDVDFMCREPAPTGDGFQKARSSLVSWRDRSAAEVSRRASSSSSLRRRAAACTALRSAISVRASANRSVAPAACPRAIHF